MIVKVKAPKVEKEAEVDYDFGDNIQQSIELHGEAAVHTGFIKASVVDLQAGMRRTLEAGGDANVYASQFKPGVKMPSMPKDPMAAAKLAIGQMSDEDKQALINELMA